MLQYPDHKPVASIEENSYEMGEVAARLLFKMIKDESNNRIKTTQHIQIPCRLVVHK
ncbi:MAG: hypothetical protein ABR502_10085 [Chitinophagaceae bacterium]